MNLFHAFLFILCSFPSFCSVLNGLPVETCTSVNSYSCHNSTVCIPTKYQCDGEADCPLRDDEDSCDDKVSGCGDLLHQYGETGTISTMGFPHHYPNLAVCRWTINVPEGKVMILHFDQLFDLEKARQGECVFDKVIIFQTDPIKKIGEYCGHTAPSPINVNSNQVMVEFMSDRDNGGRGFRLHWTSRDVASTSKKPMTENFSTQIRSSSTASPVPMCDFSTNLGGKSGDFAAPTFSSHENTSKPITCSWLITVDPGYFVVLRFKRLYLSGLFGPSACQNTSLRLYDGEDSSASIIFTLCGSIVPKQAVSTSNKLFIELSVSTPNPDIVFKATYQAVQIPMSTTLPPPPRGCDGTPIVVTSSNGFITSPQFDGTTRYRNFLDCQWVLIGKPGQVFKISFVDFVVEQSVDCRFDFVRIVDFNHDVGVNETINKDDIDMIQGNRSIVELSANITQYLNETFCSVKLPPKTESKTSIVSIFFHSDDQVAGLGFNLTYELGPPSVVCAENEFKCTNEECIDLSRVCDGVPSCQDGSDELICPNNTNCGQPAIQANLHEVRIVGGAEARKGAWPWTISIHAEDKTHLCGAALILPGWAISAAHCFDRYVNGKYGQLSLVAGRHELRHVTNGEQRRYIEDIFVPETYFAYTSRDDLSLIKLKDPFDMSDSKIISTVCLPSDKAPSGRVGWITGWGETLNTCCADKLKQAAIPVLNASLCLEYYGDRIYPHMMCAGYPEGGTDSCRGDSGGPYVMQRYQDSRWEIQGVTSWGEQCGLPRNPGVYSIVKEFMPWIQQTIASNIN